MVMPRSAIMLGSHVRTQRHAEECDEADHAGDDTAAVQCTRRTVFPRRIDATVLQFEQPWSHRGH